MKMKKGLIITGAAVIVLGTGYAISAAAQGTDNTGTPAESTVTTPLSNTEQTNTISEEEAKQIAFEHAGIEEADAVKLKIKTDREDGREVYEVDFDTADQEYEYDIDAETGEIVKTDTDTRNVKNSTKTDPSGSSRAVTEEEAKQAAFEHAGVEESDATSLTIKIDEEDDQEIYDVEFRTEEKKYEYEIDTVSGEVVSSDIDQKNSTNTDEAGSEYIGLDEAKAIALEKVSGAADKHIRIELDDEDDDRSKYEGEIIFEEKEYDFEIDAFTGEIVDWDTESVYDD